MDITFAEKLRPIFEPARFKVISGGRASGKSHGIARYLIVSALQEKHRILCTREYQTSVAKSVHQLLSDIIAEYELDAYFKIHRDKGGIVDGNADFLNRSYQKIVVTILANNRRE